MTTDTLCIGTSSSSGNRLAINGLRPGPHVDAAGERGHFTVLGYGDPGIELIRRNWRTRIACGWLVANEGRHLWRNAELVYEGSSVHW